MAFAVVVTLSLRSGVTAEFMPIMRKNAQASLQNEAGCQRFDVVTDPDREDHVFLYEVYDDAAAFDAHLASDHFKAFDAAVSEMVAEKDVRTYRSVFP